MRTRCWRWCVNTTLRYASFPRTTCATCTCPGPDDNDQVPAVMIEAHSDEVGFMVQFVKPNGMLQVVPLGGWTPEVVLGQKMLVRNLNGDYLTGVVGAKTAPFSAPGPEEPKTHLAGNGHRPGG